MEFLWRIVQQIYFATESRIRCTKKFWYAVTRCEFSVLKIPREFECVIENAPHNLLPAEGFLVFGGIMCISSRVISARSAPRYARGWKRGDRNESNGGLERKKIEEDTNYERRRVCTATDRALSDSQNTRVRIAMYAHIQDSMSYVRATNRAIYSLTEQQIAKEQQGDSVGMHACIYKMIPYRSRAEIIIQQEPWRKKHRGGTFYLLENIAKD